MADMQLVLSTMVFPHFDPSLHLPLAARAGISTLELSSNCFDHLHSPAFAAFAEAFRASGVAVNSIHVPFTGSGPTGRCSLTDTEAAARQEALDMAGLCLERLQDLGGRHIVLHASGDFVADDERQRKSDLLREGLLHLLAGVSAPNVVRIAVESLHKTSLGRNARDLVDIVDAVGDSRVGICLDTNHANLVEDIVEATRIYCPRLIAVHVSDNDGVAERHWLPFRGVIPWQSWMGMLADNGYAGPLVFEVSPRDAVQRGLSDEAWLAEVRCCSDRLLSWADELHAGET